MADSVFENDKTGGETRSNFRQDRRQFLQKLCAGAAAAVGSQAGLREAYSAQGGQWAAQAPAEKLPTIKIGNHSCNAHGSVRSAYPGKGPDGYLTTSAELPQENTLSRGRSSGVQIVQGTQQISHAGISLADFDSQGPLSASRQELNRIEPFANALSKIQPHQPGFGEDDSLGVGCLKFLEPGLHVPADILDF